MAYELNEVVTKIGNISFEGNIIPHEWYLHLRNDNGKIQTNAILLLADLVYWYRPISIFDEVTGKLIGYGRKFSGDLLQRSYKDLGEKFGLTDRQIRDALIFLEERGIAYREFRNITINGFRLNNVMYLGINPEKISEITKKKSCENSTNPTKPFNPKKPLGASKEASREVPKNGNTYSQKCEQGGSKKKLAHDKNPNTYTKTTSKISPKNLKINDWTLTFSTDEKKFLNYLLQIKPAKGDSISKDGATWWIKDFGIERIKTALKVYWQQVEKAQKDPNVPIPESIGAYTREALNKNTRPIQESDLRNKAFVENFKVSKQWYELTIKEKYCRIEDTGKEWYYHLPETLFRESILNFYENYFVNLNASMEIV